jgi:hypothetical protein
MQADDSGGAEMKIDKSWLQRVELVLGIVVVVVVVLGWLVSQFVA